jgi:hypothetical protein
VREWWEVTDDLNQEVVPQLDDDTRGFARGLHSGGEGVIFAAVVLDAAADSEAVVRPELLDDVEQVILPDADGSDREELVSALAALRRPVAV